ncbi:MAG: hypothetical protein K9H06_20825 [Melioribacteraceae bacterium]|nr:hypothetical protein [Melioribacteraceae bacterium]
MLGQSVSTSLKFLNKSQWWSREQIAEYQNKRLRNLIQHSIDSVPYYSDLFHNLNLTFKDIQTTADLCKLPILTKSEIKKQGKERLLSTRYPKNRILSASSSGSTGEPLFYKTTKDAYSMNIAANLRGWRWMGYNIGDKYIKLSQNPRNNTIKRIQDKISGNLYLATNPLIESNYKFILNEIERYQPIVIRCYPDPLLFLARYRKQHPEFGYTPKSVTTTGNTLYPETRAEIEDAFNCKIFDSYSCEGNSTVFECPTHNGYHSAEEYGISEIIDQEGNPVTHGIGKLISTDLWNLAHPFIRYDTQDLVEIDSEPCACGRSHLKIKRIIGRDNDILKMPNGRYFIVHNFTVFFQTDHPELKRSVDQFQVLKSEEKVTFRLAVNTNFNDEIGLFIRRHWMKEFDFNVEVEVVDEILPSKNGKHKFILNE